MTFSFSLLLISVGLAMLGLCLSCAGYYDSPFVWGIFTVSNGLSFIHSVIENSTGSAIISGICAIYSVYQWWNSGPGNKLKKAARELGDKSRQRIQALVDSLAPEPQGSAV